MTPDLYKTLGVAKTATADEIKKAYRTLAKEHHPDRGGNREAFQQLTLAYNVLSDQQERKIYDETGELSDTRSIETEATALACQLFDNAVNHNSVEMLLGTDLLGQLGKGIDQAIKQGHAEILQANRQISKCNAVKSKLHCRVETQPFLEIWLGQKIEDQKSRIKDFGRVISVSEKAKELLKNYTFDYQQSPVYGAWTGYNRADSYRGLLDIMGQSTTA